MGDDSKPPIDRDFVTYAQASRHLAEAHIGQQDFSGLPVPVAGLNLVLETRYKHKRLNEFRWKEYYDENGIHQVIDEPPPAKKSEFKTVNSWWNARYQTTIFVVHDEQGHAQARFLVDDRLSMTIRTLDAAAAWPVEAEQKAQQKLASLITAEAFELYGLAGHFTEISKRSRLAYLFRKGRPTIALRQDDEFRRALCALCLHPIGYYGHTWAGVMCPTDEVIAHLLMMRGSEEKYWANANQHSLDHPAAGL